MNLKLEFSTTSFISLRFLETEETSIHEEEEEEEKEEEKVMLINSGIVRKREMSLSIKQYIVNCMQWI